MITLPEGVFSLRLLASDVRYPEQVRTQGRLMVPRWNFHKHLIDADGHLVDWFASTTAPDSRKVVAAIERVLVR